MEACEHKPEWIRQRDGAEYYCTVCRVPLYDDFFNILTEEERNLVGRSFDYILEQSIESTRQRGS